MEFTFVQRALSTDSLISQRENLILLVRIVPLFLRCYHNLRIEEFLWGCLPCSLPVYLTNSWFYLVACWCFVRQTVVFPFFKMTNVTRIFF